MPPDRAAPILPPLLREGAALFTTNPFDERWLGIQRRILGATYQETGRVLALVDDPALPNLARVIELLLPAHVAFRKRLQAGAAATPEDLSAYVAVGLLLLHHGFAAELQAVADTGDAAGDLFSRFRANHRAMFSLPNVPIDAPPPRVAFEVCYQARRAFHAIHTTLRGVSTEAGKLRARVWNACFPGGDLLRYARGGYERRNGAHILILGDTGTGKELVARALAHARYLPYHETNHRFAGRAEEGFHAVNTSGMPRELADSVLFGHRKGAFTGADRDAPGVLAKCVAWEVLFLDEFGDLLPEIQIKLLRVLEDRKYTPLGSSEEKALGGMLVFAAQPALFQGRGFRRDLRHRLGQHVIRVPSLRARIDADPAELPFLVGLFAEEVAGPADAGVLSAAVLRIVQGRLRSHPWKGNVRELKACVTSIHEQQEYVPASALAEPSVPAPSRPSSAPPSPSRPAPSPARSSRVPPSLTPPEPGADLAREVLDGTINLEELRRRYILHIYAIVGSYTEAGRRLGIDWRTVRTAVEAVKREASRAKRPAA